MVFQLGFFMSLRACNWFFNTTDNKPRANLRKLLIFFAIAYKIPAIVLCLQIKADY